MKKKKLKKGYEFQSEKGEGGELRIEPSFEGRREVRGLGTIGLFFFTICLVLIFDG